jgi:thymidine kinase
MSVELVEGPMFAGKTGICFEFIKRSLQEGRKTAVITYTGDTRYGTGLWTHDGRNVPSVHGDSLSEPKIQEEVENASVVVIDEGQFFPDLKEFCDKWASEGKIILVAALDTDFKREPFENVRDLCPDFRTKLTSTCVHCQKPAGFTRRKTNDKEVQMIGGADEYEPVCRTCSSIKF